MMLPACAADTIVAVLVAASSFGLRVVVQGGPSAREALYGMDS
jgi:hypothetical protein